MVVPEDRVREHGKGKEGRVEAGIGAVLDDVAGSVRRLPGFRLECLVLADDVGDRPGFGYARGATFQSGLEWVEAAGLVVFLRSLFGLGEYRAGKPQRTGIGRRPPIAGGSRRRAMNTSAAARAERVRRSILSQI